MVTWWFPLLHGKHLNLSFPNNGGLNEVGFALGKLTTCIKLSLVKQLIVNGLHGSNIFPCFFLTKECMLPYYITAGLLIPSKWFFFLFSLFLSWAKRKYPLKSVWNVHYKWWTPFSIWTFEGNKNDWRQWWWPSLQMKVVETLADIVIKDLESSIFSFLQQTMRNCGFISEVWC